MSLKMHKLVDLGPQVPREPCMWKKLHMFLEQYPPEKEFPDTKRLAENNISRQRLTGYFQWVSRIILPIRPNCYTILFVSFPCFEHLLYRCKKRHSKTQSINELIRQILSQIFFFSLRSWKSKPYLSKKGFFPQFASWKKNHNKYSLKKS